MGLVSDLTTIRTAMLVPALCFALVAAFAARSLSSAPDGSFSR
jgi:fucose permease